MQLTLRTRCQGRWWVHFKVLLASEAGICGAAVFMSCAFRLCSRLSCCTCYLILLMSCCLHCLACPSSSPQLRHTSTCGMRCMAALRGRQVGMGEQDARRAAAELRQRNLEWHRHQEKARAAAARPWSDATDEGQSYLHSNTPVRGSGMVRPASAYPAYQQQAPLAAQGPTTQRHGRASGAGIGPGAQYLSLGVSGWNGSTNQGGGSPVPYQYGLSEKGVGKYHQQYEVRPFSPAPVAGGRPRPQSAPKARGSGSAAAPYGIDKPSPPIRASDVRARQEAFYAKHYKPPTPVRLGHQHVTPADYKRPVDRAGFEAADSLAFGKR